MIEGIELLRELGLPAAQCNERSALCLLALLGISKDQTWKDATRPQLGVTPIMKWIADQGYRKPYAPNTRETIRRQTLHQFINAEIVLMNPDAAKSVNAPGTVYQVSSDAYKLVRSYRSAQWDRELAKFHATHPPLQLRNERPRKLPFIPLLIPGGKRLRISTGDHSELIKAIVEQFGPRFVPNGAVLYVGDTGKKWLLNDIEAFASLGITLDRHGKMPDVVLYYRERNWLILAEAVTSHGPVDAKRHDELKSIFGSGTAGLVYLTAFPSRRQMARYLGTISWETEVWCADAPDHLIHFNGERFLGPYSDHV